MTESRLPEGPAGRPLTGLFVALVLAVAGRISFISSQSLTMDEVTELGIAKGTIGQIVQTVDGFPPLYHLLLHGWLALFGTDAAARWLSVLFGLLTVLCVWNLARLLVGRRGADRAAILFSVMPFHIWYSQEARAYSLVIFLTALTLWLFFRARARNGWGDWAWFVVAGAAGMYAHYFFAVALGTLALCLLFERRPAPSARRGWVSLAVLAAICVPELSLLRIDLTYQVDPRIGKPTFGPAALGYTYFSFVSGFTVGPSMRALHSLSPGEALRAAAPWLLLVGLAVGYPTWAVIRAPGEGLERRSLLILCLVPVILLGILTMVAHVGYNVRYGSWVVVPVAVWIGAGLAQTIRRWEGKAALVVLMAVFILARWNRVFVDTYREEDNRAVAAFLQEQEPLSQHVLVTAGYMVRPVGYYLGGQWTVDRIPIVSASGEGLEEAVTSIVSARSTGQEIWLVYTRAFHGDPGGLLLDRLSGAVLRRETFAGTDLYLIDPNQL